IAFGGGSLCMTVDVISHGLSVRPAGVRTTTTPFGSFASNERYVVVVTGSQGAFLPVSFRDTFTPAVGMAGVRLINVTAGTTSYDLHVTDPGAALSTPNVSSVAAGTASAYFNTATKSQQLRVTVAGSTILASDLGNHTLAAGSRGIVIIASPASGG